MTQQVEIKFRVNDHLLVYRGEEQNEGNINFFLYELERQLAVLIPRLRKDVKLLYGDARNDRMGGPTWPLDVSGVKGPI